jgi:acetylornithine deacetylase/succinyl-diaminopimelate desuccinylase-like protein
VQARVDAVFNDLRIQRAFRFISERESEIESQQIRLTEIPAPPFGENERALAFSEELLKLHLRPETDRIGNVAAAYDGMGRSPVVIGAHLDTVFPASTPLKLRRKGRTLYLPGVSDNGCGIAAALWMVRAAKENGIVFRRPVILVGNVGEEGEGNLRGIRQLFDDPPWQGRECDFIAVDGAGLQRVTHQGLGSRRFRVHMTGPGGHSWADFGRPNPVQAMAGAIHAFSALRGIRRPGTSFNFGVVRGGISVNAIPREAIMEVDLRSIASANLDELENQLRRSISEATRAAGVECRIEFMGERPSGVTPVSSPIVVAALEVTRRLGFEALTDVGSTDANLPISMGIPAIALGGGGTSGNVHTPEEWFDPVRRDLGIQRLLALVAVLAGLD